MITQNIKYILDKLLVFFFHKWDVLQEFKEIERIYSLTLVNITSHPDKISYLLEYL